MNAAAKLGAFVAGLAVLFAAAFGVGAAVGPVAGAAGAGGAHGSTGPLPGLTSSRDGVTLVPQQLTATAGTPGSYRFTILGPDGRALTEYDETHERDLHLVVVRRDLTGFQHLHPTRATDGSWSVPLTPTAPGAYRVLADLTPRGAARVTLGVDLAVAGPVTPRPLPAAARTTSVDGYDIALDVPGDGSTPGSALVAGREQRLTFTVTRDGRPADLEPHLGAAAHLVVLRAGDLAYLHPHADGTRSGGTVRIDVTAPSVGAYRAYLEFKVAAAVHRAELTLTATSGGAGR